MTRHEVCIEDTGERFDCRPDESVLNAMARLGRRGIPAGCRGGGCGVCKVRVVAGDYVAATMSRSHVSEREQAEGIVLACRIRACSDLSVRVVGGMRKAMARHAPCRGCSGDDAGMSVPVIEPPELRARLAEEFAALAQRYSDVDA